MIRNHRLPSGAEYLLIARDEADLLAWVDAINKAIHSQTPAIPLSSQATHFREQKFFQKTKQFLTLSDNAAPSAMNPVTAVPTPIASSGADTPPDSLPPPPAPSSIPPPLDEDKVHIVYRMQ